MTLRSSDRARILLAGCVAVLLLAPASAPAQSKKAFDEAREAMVQTDLIGNGIKNPRVLEAMRKTLRHEFVPINVRQNAYRDMALAIGDSQTISGTYIVALMTEQLDPQPTDKVLEIGTGSGYQAAVLAALVKDVYTIEIVEPLAKKATATLARLKYKNVHTLAGDGYKGWRQHAPFDKIIVTCSPERVPEPLIAQLKEGGRIVVPVGERYQQTLYRFTKKKGKLEPEAIQPTFFVPMTGAAEDRRVIKPDPTRPKINNGGFELLAEGTELPSAWYYLQQMELVAEAGAPDGKRFACFTNEDPGRIARAWQGFPVDGRKVRELDVSFQLKGQNLRPGPSRDHTALVGVTFFDERRAPLGEQTIGTWYGTFDWQKQREILPVPPKAREASLRIGLFGGTGKMCIDAVEVKAAEAKRP
ncbi:MAG: protein-L-isoaspartate(D-aspartate) O-methyltransferase [Pirellulales bacterium]